MNIIRTLLTRPIGTSRRYDWVLPAPTSVAVLVGEGDHPFGRPAWGCLVRTGMLWRNATLQLSTTEGLVTAVGMKEAIATLRAFDPHARIRIALPVHQGYLALYGEDGRMAARVLETEAGLEVRFMDPHRSYVESRNVDDVVERAFRQIEDDRDQKA